MGERFVDALDPVVVAGDHLGAVELLESLEGTARAEAKAWFAANKRWLDQAPNRTYDKSGMEAYHAASWIVGLCALALCGPRSAAQRVPWRQFWDHVREPGEDTFVHALWDKDPAWAAEFVHEASRVSLGSAASNSNAVLSAVLRAVVVHHGLACPSGPTFLRAWWAGTSLGHPGRFGRAPVSLAAQLKTDPLMPDLVYHYLASGHCGETRGLPDALAELTADGLTDRSIILDTVVEKLTTQQRPASQTALAHTTQALGLRASEIAGGLDYLVGVLSTCYRTVVPILLPHALELVDGDGLDELVGTLAARPEKGPRETMLKALSDPRFQSRVGTPATLSALRLLSGGEDATFTEKVAAVAARLAPEEAPEEATDATLGLWELQPAPRGVTLSWSDQPLDLDWAAALGGASDLALSWQLDQTLQAMGADRFDPTRLLDDVHGLLLGRRLSMPRLVRVLGDLFLSGGMRQSWATTLAIADLACATQPAPSGLADLLRFLGQFAAEAPPSEVPAGLDALARSGRRSKAQTEARHLAAKLMRVPVADIEGQLAARYADRQVVPTRQGRWGAGEPDETALPSHQRIVAEADRAEEAEEDLARLHRIPSASGYSFGTSRWLPPPTPRPHPETAIDKIVQAVRIHGASAVREALGRLWYSPGEKHLLSLHYWRDGPLEPAQLWQLMTEPLTGSTLGWPHTRLRFLLIYEALVLAERQPGERVPRLATPTWADHTLDLDAFLERFARTAASPSKAVGALDLVVALHRLRRFDPAAVGEIPDGVRTDPLFAAYGEEPRDASALVRRWVTAGGLPDLRPTLDADHKWTGDVGTPVPFTSLVGLPPDLDLWPIPDHETLDLMPRWVDRVVEGGLRDDRVDSSLPLFGAEPPGTPVLERLIGNLAGRVPPPKDDKPLRQLAQLCAYDRVRPEPWVEATLLRHRAGVLHVAALTPRFHQAILRDGFRCLWRALLAMAEALAAEAEPPEDLTELLRLLTAYAHEVPADQVRIPDILVAAAEEDAYDGAAAALVTALRRAADAGTGPAGKGQA